METGFQAKLWVARNLLSSHFPDEAVELLVAHSFVAPGGFDEPHGAVSGFLRFLKLLVRSGVADC